MLGRTVTRGQGPMEAVEKLEDVAVVYDMGNTRMGTAQEQDRLVWGEMVEAAWSGGRVAGLGDGWGWTGCIDAT